MSNSTFSFKQFTIRQDRCAMKVGTDGVLLGAWVNLNNALKILDVGTGTGLIAIMMAQRSDARIDAVEIDENAFAQATENVNYSPWRDRIQIFHDAFQHFADIATSHYDVVVSNPPYFRNSLKPSMKQRSYARHDEQLNYESLLFHAARILTPYGRLSVIVPAFETEYLITAAYFKGLFPSKLTMVSSVAGKDYSRCLAEFTFKKSGVPVHDTIVIREKGLKEYTVEYKALAGDYYLNF
jgi:tRNA1Val (adenine37-N6)-methyltransferase